MARSRLFMVLGRALAFRAAISLATAPAFVLLLAAPVAPAHAQTAVDTTTPSIIEDLVSYKVAEEGGALTASQTSVMPSLFASGVDSLVAEEAAAATGAIVSGPVGWLALAAGLGFLAAGAFSAYQGAATSGAAAISCTSATVCSNGGLRGTGANLTANATSYKVNSGNIVGVGSDPESALAEGISQNNGKSGATQYQEAQSCSTSAMQCYVEVVPKSGATTAPSVTYVAITTFTPTIGANYPAAAGYTAASGSTPASYTSPAVPTPQSNNANLQTTTSSNLTSTQTAATANNQALADLANNVWKQAAGINTSFPAPSTSDPITAADVANMLKSNTISAPTVANLAASAGTVTAESGGAVKSADVSATTWPTPASVTVGTGTGTGTGSGTTSSTEPPCGNLAAGEPTCEVDWGSAPTLTQPDPTMPLPDTGFLAPFFNIMPKVSALSVPAHTASCSLPTIQTTAFGGQLGTVDTSGICSMLTKSQPTLETIFGTSWMVAALYILMAA